jgi:hypothetical protein
VAADPLDRLAELDLAPVDADLVVGPQPVGDVRRRHRAEQRAGRAGLHLEPQHALLEAGRDVARLVVRPRFLAGAHLFAAPELLERPGRGGLGQLSRQQEVAGVAVGDVDDLAAQPDLLDVLEEDDLHEA